MSKNRVALMLTGVTSTNCGGAERFFSDFFSRYVTENGNENELYFFTDSGTVLNMRQLGKLRTDKNVIVLSNFSNRFKNILETAEFLFHIVKNRINLLQITSYTPSFYARVSGLSRLPEFLRPRLALTVVDCEIPYALGNPQHPKHQAYLIKYAPLFQNVKIDGVLSWYKKFLEFAAQKGIFKGAPHMYSVTTRYADTEEKEYALTNKEKLLVWAGRMVVQKNPLMLLKALKMLKEEGFDTGGWKVELYGDGELTEGVKAYIEENSLNKSVFLMGNKNLDTVFKRSAGFISTQEYENFPSLSMMEAMHYGNVIISRNVGQTYLMVNDRKNGFLLKLDSAAGLASAIKDFIENENLHPEMGKESIRLTREVHTYGNFKVAINDFWKAILSDDKPGKR